MAWIAELAGWSVVAFGLLLFVVQMAAREIGYYVGRRHSKGHEGRGEGVGAVVGAMLGLLAFVLALTLSFANARFAERRAGTLAEANAIGTAWLRAEAIDHPRAVEIARLLEEYAEMRAAFVRAGYDAGAIGAANTRTTELQSEVWGHVTALVRDRADPVTASLMAAVNETFDASTAERFALAFTLPPRLFWILIGMALLGMAALGYQLGLRGNPLRILSALLIAMWTLIIVSILDLAAARVGTLRTSAVAYEWTRDGFRGGVTIPALPARP
ncbi:hypothetical protein HMPREF9946_01385 [Acetobacteraceae bacterium AT-5844]|nr:hypothetical protein HMPREF9946_01385 [Acetobacteraceae bacterium AT-5844]